MFHNLYLKIAANSYLVIFWHGQRAHNAYWVLLGESPTSSAPFCVTDGPFPNQYMAAADFFKRGPGLAGWGRIGVGDGSSSVAADWEEQFGVNFKKAFQAVGSDGVEVAGALYISFLT